jgi:threonine synthase
LFTKVAKGFRELAEVGLVAGKVVKFVGAQPEGCAPVATAFATGAETIIPVREPSTIVRSLAIGSPADGSFALDLARSTGGSIEAVSDTSTAESIRILGRLEGIQAETAGGVTVSAARQARESGVLDPDEQVVVLITGNGVKTPDARRFGLDGSVSLGAGGGVAAPIAPSLGAFEDWLSRVQV